MSRLASSVCTIMRLIALINLLAVGTAVSQDLDWWITIIASSTKFNAFAPEQPDLDFRDPEVRREMRDVLAFWMKRGRSRWFPRGRGQPSVRGLRRMLDEPASGRDVPSVDYGYLEHIHSRDLEEVYTHVGGWQELLDECAREHRTDAKILVPEALQERAKYNAVLRSWR